LFLTTRAPLHRANHIWYPGPFQGLGTDGVEQRLSEGFWFRPATARPSLSFSLLSSLYSLFPILKKLSLLSQFYSSLYLIHFHPMYTGPLGLPFVLEEDKVGSLTNTTFTDIYGRLTIRFDESLSRPGRSVTMIRVVSADTAQAPLVPEAVLDFDTSTKGELGSIMFPPKSSMPLDAYMQKITSQNG